MRNIRCVQCSDGGLSGRSCWNVNACRRGTRVPRGMTRPNAVFSISAEHSTSHYQGHVWSSINHLTHTPCTLWYLKKLANTVQNLHVPWRLRVDLFSMCTWDASVCKHQQATAFFPLNNAALCNRSAPWPKIDQQLSWLSHTTLWQHSHSVRVLSCFTCECENTLKPVMLQMTNWHFHWIWYKKLQF